MEINNISNKNNKNNTIKSNKYNNHKNISNIGVPILIMDPWTKRSNIVEVSKFLDIYVQQHYKTLEDCIKIFKLRDIIPPRRPTTTTNDFLYSMINNPNFMTLLIQMLLHVYNKQVQQNLPDSIYYY